MAKIKISEDQNTVTVNNKEYEFVTLPYRLQKLECSICDFKPITSDICVSVKCCLPERIDKKTDISDLSNHDPRHPHPRETLQT